MLNEYNDDEFRRFLDSLLGDVVRWRTPNVLYVCNTGSLNTH